MTKDFSVSTRWTCFFALVERRTHGQIFTVWVLLVSRNFLFSMTKSFTVRREIAADLRPFFFGKWSNRAQEQSLVFDRILHNYHACVYNKINSVSLHRSLRQEAYNQFCMYNRSQRCSWIIQMHWADTSERGCLSLHGIEVNM